MMPVGGPRKVLTYATGRRMSSRRAALSGLKLNTLPMIDAVLRRDTEQREQVRFLRLVIAIPVAHLRVLENAGRVAALGIGDLHVLHRTHCFSLAQLPRSCRTPG